MDQQRLPDSFATNVLDADLERIFHREGEKLARAVDRRRGRRALSMLREAEERGIGGPLLAFYRRTLFEAFMRYLNRPAR